MTSRSAVPPSYVQVGYCLQAAARCASYPFNVCVRYSTCAGTTLPGAGEDVGAKTEHGPFPAWVSRAAALSPIIALTKLEMLPHSPTTKIRAWGRADARWPRTEANASRNAG